MTTQDTFVTPEIANLLRDKGFREPCLAILHEGQSAKLGNTWDQALQWLREKHGIHVVVIPTVTCFWTYKTIRVLIEGEEINKPIETPPYKDVAANDYSTYYRALSEGIKHALTLVK